MTTLPDPDLPCLQEITVTGATTLELNWQDGSRHTIDLSGFIRLTEKAKSLLDPDLFAKAKCDEYGNAVLWPSPTGGQDLGIGADQLAVIAIEQAAFDNTDFKAWQERLNLTNQAAAEALGVALNTVKNYRSGGTIPDMAAIACRHLENNKMALAARYTSRNK